jgi:GT2 family glycosyltransferase
MKKVCAIVVTYNRAELLRSCIESLLLQRPLDGIIVVDNCSGDGTHVYLSALVNEHFHVYRMNENTGGAGGFHYGLRKSVELGYEYSWIMDDDAIPRDGALDALLKAAEVLDWDFGFLSSKVVSEHGDVINIPIVDMSRNDAGCPRWADQLEHGMVRIRRSTFVSVFVPNAMLRLYGLPIKEMFIWGDDSEFTLRLSDKHACYVVGQSVVLHKRKSNKSLSVYSEENRTRIQLYYYFYRNAVYAIRKDEKSFHEKIYALLRLMSAVFLIPFRSRTHLSLRMAVVIRGVAAGFFFRPRIAMP